jgi:hypothetical protein
MSKTRSKPTTAPDPQRDVLSRKRRRTATYVVELEDPSEARAALSTIASRLQLLAALHGEDSEQAAALHPELEQAQAALDACSHTITLRALGAQHFPDLVKAHPPTKEQQAERGDWNPDTFHAALIAACAADEGLTERQWADALDSDAWATGERNALFNLALQLNVSAPNSAVTALAGLRADERYRSTGRL